MFTNHISNENKYVEYVKYSYNSATKKHKIQLKMAGLPWWRSG